MTTVTSPDDPRRVVVVDALTDDEARYIAKYVARAMFVRGDYFAAICTGVEYHKDPSLHELFFEAIYTRGAVLAQILTTQDRNAVRLVYPPGVPNRFYDHSYRSGRDEAFDKFVELSGGVDAVKSRQAQESEGNRRQVTQRYGDESGLQCWRSMMFAVHPDFQSRGYGKVMHDYTMKEVEASGLPWFFTSLKVNVPYYERSGCRAIGEEYFSCSGVSGEYPEDGRVFRIIEAGPSVEEAVSRGLMKVCAI